MLPGMKGMEEEAFEKKITIVAYLGVLINMWNFPKVFKVDSRRNGIPRYLADKYDMEVKTTLMIHDCKFAYLQQRLEFTRALQIPAAHQVLYS